MLIGKENAWGIVFPGQGSQSVGMLADIALHHPAILETFEEASTILQYDLWDMVTNGPKEKLDQTRFTQPALLTTSYALYRLIHEKCQQLGIKAMAGHSLGEYTALVAAGALPFKDALLLVAARGFYMQEAVPEGTGAMAAIVGLTDAEITTLCETIKQDLPGGVLAPANLNSVGQVVIAGHRELVIDAIQGAKAQGAKIATLLPVSVPSHCALMKPAAKRLQADLATVPIQIPRLPVISNVTVTAYESIGQIAESLVEQLYSPVRWVDTVHLFGRLDIRHVIECGPGKVLAGLIKRTDKSITVYSLGELDSLSAFLADSLN